MVDPPKRIKRTTLRITDWWQFEGEVPGIAKKLPEVEKPKADYVLVLFMPKVGET